MVQVFLFHESSEGFCGALLDILPNTGTDRYHMKGSIVFLVVFEAELTQRIYSTLYDIFTCNLPYKI